MLTVSAPLTLSPSIENGKVDHGELTFGSMSCREAEQALTGDIETWGRLGLGARTHKAHLRWVTGQMRTVHARERHHTAQADLRQT